MRTNREHFCPHVKSDSINERRRKEWWLRNSLRPSGNQHFVSEIITPGSDVSCIDPAAWRLRAAACHEVAVNMVFPECRDKMRRLAREWSRLADRLEAAFAAQAELKMAA